MSLYFWKELDVFDTALKHSIHILQHSRNLYFTVFSNIEFLYFNIPRTCISCYSPTHSSWTIHIIFSLDIYCDPEFGKNRKIIRRMAKVHFCYKMLLHFKNTLLFEEPKKSFQFFRYRDSLKPLLRLFSKNSINPVTKLNNVKFLGLRNLIYKLKIFFVKKTFHGKQPCFY